MKRLQAPILLLLLSTPVAAFAHPGHGGLLTGFIHPWSGLDHLAAMLAIGLLAARAPERMRWLLPAGFVLAAFTGATLGFAGIVLPSLETVIATSVIALGALLTLRANALPTLWLFAMTLPWGLFHGNAHALEAGPSPAPFVAGFLIGTATLHALGLLAGRTIQDSALRVLGLGIMGVGSLLLTGVIA